MLEYDNLFAAVLQGGCILKKLIFILLVFITVFNHDVQAMDKLPVPVLEAGKATLTDLDMSDRTGELKRMNEEISNYLEKNLGFKSINGKVFEAHELYCIDKKGNKIYAYLWSRLQEYAYENHQLINGSGSSLPVVVVLKESEDGNYTVLEHKVPKEGSQFTVSVKEMFPKEYQDKILSRTNSNRLEEIVREKALYYFIQSGEFNP